MKRASKSKEQATRAGGRQSKPSRTDAQIAAIFQDMRKVAGLAPVQLAKQLGTRPATISALEKGAIGALPEWSETSRIIRDYAALVQIDAGPLLRHVALELTPSKAESEASIGKAAPAKAETGGGKSEKRRRRPWVIASIALLLIVIAGLGAAGFYAVRNPQFVKSALETLPEPVGRAARSIRALFDQIDVGGAAVDPRHSRPDKLPGDAITVPPPR
jgi:cytoskeleton protein RodZ